MIQGQIPSGTITFLFTDIEGSSKLWEVYPEQMRVSLARHDSLLRTTFAGFHGYVFKTIGDAFCVAFGNPSEALEAALAAQLALATEPWCAQTPIRVRMALHTGAVECRDNDYFGPPVNRVSRILSTGHGGQSLLSRTTFDLVRDNLPRGVSLKDLGEHQLRDLARPEQIFQLLYLGLDSEFPPLRSLSNVPNNLPQQTTSFIGRESETEAVQALLRKNRLVTLTGTGGTGKTRLSLQVAANLLDQYPDGAWFVELAPLGDPQLVAAAAAAGLGLKEEPGKTVLESLVDHLKSKRALLVFDNCEHVLDGSSSLADTLLRRCADIRILASSREALGVGGEQTFRVPSMTLPEPNVIPTADSLNQFEAVRLFIDRSILAKSDFTVTNQSAPAVASICVRLDGIPLAIELAAARSRSLSPQQIDQRLDDRFRLLNSGLRTALPRQQTLRSLIDWSYELLTDEEKALLQRLSVFCGGWSLEASECVCSDSKLSLEIEGNQVLDLLSSLVDKSLVVTEDHGGHPRFRLLESIRQYAAERLGQTASYSTLRARHLAYYCELAATSHEHHRKADHSTWLDLLEVEHDNLRAATAWGLQSGDVRSVLRVAGSLGGPDGFWYVRGYFSEGRSWLEQAIERAGTTESEEKILALLALADLIRVQGEIDRAETYASETLAESRRLGFKDGTCRALRGLAHIANFRGHWKTGIAYLEEALGLVGDLYTRADLLLLLSAVTRDATGVSNDQLDDEAMAIYRELGDARSLASSLHTLGIRSMEQRKFEDGVRLFDECIALNREIGYKRGVALGLNNKALCLVGLGMLDEAGKDLVEGLRIRIKLGVPLGLAYSLENFAILSKSLGRLEDWARLSGAAYALRERLGAPVPIMDYPHEDQRMFDPATSGNEGLLAAWTDGLAMPVEAAIAHALAEFGGGRA